MTVEKQFILREVAGEYIVIPTGRMAQKFSGMMSLNEIGVLLWKKLQNDVTLEDLVCAVTDEYDVQPEVAREDIQAFLDKLDSREILIRDAV